MIPGTSRRRPPCRCATLPLLVSGGEPAGIREVPPILFVLSPARSVAKGSGWNRSRTDLNQFDRFCPLKKREPELILPHFSFTETETQTCHLSNPYKWRWNCLGVEHEFNPLSGEGYGFDGKVHDPQTIKGFERVLAFLNRHLRTRDSCFRCRALASERLLGKWNPAKLVGCRLYTEV